MKNSVRIFTLCLILVFCVAAIAATDAYRRTTVSMPDRTGDGYSVLFLTNSDGMVVSSAPSILKSVTVRNTEANGKVVIYDNASAGSGTVISKFGVATDEDAHQAIYNIACANGIYATLTNSPDVTIEYAVLY